MALLEQAGASPTAGSAASLSSSVSSATSPDSVWKRGFCWLCSSTSSGFLVSSSLPSSSSSVSSTAATPVASAQAPTRGDDETAVGELFKKNRKRPAKEGKLFLRANKHTSELKNAAYADTGVAEEMGNVDTPEYPEESFATKSRDVIEQIELTKEEKYSVPQVGIEDVSDVENCPVPTVFVCLVLGLLLADGLQQLVKKTSHNVLLKFTGGLLKIFGFLLCTAWRFCRGCGVRTLGPPAAGEQRKRTRTSGEQPASESEGEKEEERSKREETEQTATLDDNKKHSGDPTNQQIPPGAPGRGTEPKKLQQRKRLREQKNIARQRKEEEVPSAAVIREQLAALLQAKANSCTSLSSDFVFHTKLQRKILRLQQQLDVLDAAEASVRTERRKREEDKAEGSFFAKIAEQCMQKLLQKICTATLKARNRFCHALNNAIVATKSK